MVLHDVTGARVACGLLAKQTVNVDQATLTPLAEAAAFGEVKTYTFADTGTVVFLGSVTGAEADLTPENCVAKNGCGVHVHSGDSCKNSTTQGGHFYDASLSPDPWSDVQYYTNTDGAGDFFDLVHSEETDNTGQPFVVHNKAGSRVACGVLATSTATVAPVATPAVTAAPSTAATPPPYVPLPALENIHAYVATLAPFGSGSTAKGEFVAFASGTADFPMVAVAGEFTGLEANLNSTQCLKAKNGCGIHIHSGQSCASADLQARARPHI